MPVRGRGAFPKPPIETSFYDPSGSFGNARITEYRALKKLPRAGDALKMLRTVGAIVKPIMLHHDWHVPLLTEFSGSQKDGGELLGMNRNRGQVIYLRLREKGSDGKLLDSFLPEDDVVYTMLHELTHNVRGPHDDEFFRVLKALEEEWYELRRTGGSSPGNGFLTPGTRVGAGHLRDLPPHEARRQALEMAEKRRKLQAVMQGGGRLGSAGGDAGPAKPPAVLAREAAERRARISGGCPSTQMEQEKTVKWHEEEELLHGIAVVRIDDEDEESCDNVVATADDGEDKTGAKETAQRPIASSAAAEEQSASDAQPIVIGSDSDDDDPGFVTTQVKRARRAESPVRTQSSSSALGARTIPPNRRNAAPLGRSTAQRFRATPSSLMTRDPWTCATCKLENTASALLCSACRGPRTDLADGQLAGARSMARGSQRSQNRPPAVGANEAGWRCSGCGYWMGGEQAALWCCLKCSTVARK